MQAIELDDRPWIGQVPRSQVQYDYEMRPETDVDPEDDLTPAGARWVRKQLYRGNDWAWCQVEVTARWDGLTGKACLGCVSTEGLLDFMNDGTYGDLCAQAYADLQKRADKYFAQTIPL